MESKREKEREKKREKKRERGRERKREVERERVIEIEFERQREREQWLQHSLPKQMLKVREKDWRSKKCICRRNASNCCSAGVDAIKLIAIGRRVNDERADLCFLSYKCSTYQQSLNATQESLWLEYCLPKVWFPLEAVFCVFRSRLHQRRDRNYSISVWKLQLSAVDAHVKCSNVNRP